MLNQTGVTKVSGTNRKTILVDELNSTAFSIVVGNTGVEAGADGRKIIKAGTPVTGSLTERNTAFTVAKDSGGSNNAVGVILHDVDVTGGNANSQVVVFGFIDISKLESDVVALITEAAKKSMRMIQFVK